MSGNQYLSNKELLEEIHISKNSYCEYKNPKKHQDYDIIVYDLDDIFKKSTQQQAKKNRMERVANRQYQSAMAEYEKDGGTKPKLNQFKKNVDAPDIKDLVYRVYTYEHIPLDPDRKKNPRNISEEYVKINFVPFKHYMIKNEKAVEVGRSHSKDKKFCQTHGALTEKLAGMFLLLVNRYSQRANWRGYSYVDEMIGQSLLQLSEMSLKFDESKSDNPFAYYTRIIQNSFTRVLNTEKKNQRAKDEILINSGQLPSFSRQMEHEEEMKKTE